MRRRIGRVMAAALATFAVAMVMVIPAAGAADLHFDHVGSSCDGALGTWHFVNNQTATNAAAGTLTATFSSGVVVAVADKVNRRTQHWTIEAAGTLLGASTNLDGKLVLSDFSCEEPPSGSPSENF
jgi:hypothetical protein